MAQLTTPKLTPFIPRRVCGGGGGLSSGTTVRGADVNGAKGTARATFR